MKKPKRKLSAAEKAEKRRRRKEYMTVFIKGKQKRVKRPPTIEGLPDRHPGVGRDPGYFWILVKALDAGSGPA